MPRHNHSLLLGLLALSLPLTINPGGALASQSPVESFRETLAQAHIALQTPVQIAENPAGPSNSMPDYKEHTGIDVIQPGGQLAPSLGEHKEQTGIGAHKEQSGLGEIKTQTGIGEIGDIKLQTGIGEIKGQTGVGDIKLQTGISGLDGIKGQTGVGDIKLQTGIVGMDGIKGQTGIGDIKLQTGIGDIKGQTGVGDIKLQTGVGNLDGIKGLTGIDQHSQPNGVIAPIDSHGSHSIPAVSGYGMRPMSGGTQFNNSAPQLPSTIGTPAGLTPGTMGIISPNQKPAASVGVGAGIISPNQKTGISTGAGIVGPNSRIAPPVGLQSPPAGVMLNPQSLSPGGGAAISAPAMSPQIKQQAAPTPNNQGTRGILIGL